MASPLSKKKSLQARWNDMVQKITTATGQGINETEPDKKARITRLLANYGEFIVYYFPHYAKDKEGNVTECAQFHVDAANAVKADPYYKGIWEWFRGSAKSTNADIFLPLWLKFQVVRQLNVMLLVGKNNKTATRLLQDIQAELAANARLLADFGPQIKDGSWEQGEFQTQDGCAFVALGMGEPPRGTRFGANRPDFIVCDDLDDDKMKKNPSRIREAVDWICRAVIPTMDFGLARFVFVNNRIAKKGILATLVEEKPHWHHSLVNALQPDGSPTWKRYTREFYAALKKDIGWKAFETEYMNDPQEDAGVFLQEQIHWAHVTKDWSKLDAIVMYGDMSYSTGKKSDFTAIPTWAKYEGKYIKLKAYLRQDATAARAIEWWFDFYLALPPAVRVKVRCFVEANATQKILLKPIITKEARKRGVVNFIKFDTSKKGDKADRIGSMTTQYENGDVAYDISEDGDADMLASIEQLTGWEEGAKHDDGPDADQSAWAKLEELKRLSGRTEQRTGKFIKNTSRSF